MNKVWLLPPGEDWIVDRFVKEWNEDNKDICAPPTQAEVCWVFADWCWQRLGPAFLSTKKVITTVHHIVPDKFGAAQLKDFKARDAVTTCYHVPNAFTEAFIQSHTQKPIHVIPYWANQKIWKPTVSKAEVRKAYALPQDAFIVGSFQRDTEGASIASGNFEPKLEKGPDLLADYIAALAVRSGHSQAHPKLHVVLAGWRRQYLISRLETMQVPFSYIEMPQQDTINELYQALDLYPITARQEGGPQSLIECGLLNVPVVSRPIGIASNVLPASAINDDVSLATPAVPNVEHLMLPGGYEPYRRLIESL